MTIEINGKKYSLADEALEKIEQRQKEAIRLVDQHLRRPISSIIDSKVCEGHVLSYALLELAYSNLRTRYSPEKAAELIEIYTHFAKDRIDESLAQRKIH